MVRMSLLGAVAVLAVGCGGPMDDATGTNADALTTVAHYSFDNQFTNPAEGPCTGQAIDFNQSVHTDVMVQQRSSGGFVNTAHDVGTFSFTENGVTTTGSFKDNGTTVATQKGFVNILGAKGSGTSSDGSTVTLNFNVKIVYANGQPRRDVENFSVTSTCGQ